MTPQEMLKVLRGTDEEKLNLFNSLLEKAASGEGLTDDEMPIMETLKKELIRPPKVVVGMSASLTGSSAARG